MSAEMWKAIPETDGKYMVSNHGNVRSYRKYAEGRELKPYRDTCGYMYVDIFDKSVGVHRLVAQAFIPNYADKREINHKDGDKRNNRADNLEWCSRSENVKHAYGTGLKANPVRGESAKASPVICVETGVVYGCMIDATEDTGAAGANISKCCRGLRQTAGGYHWRYAGGGDC